MALSCGPATVCLRGKDPARWKEAWPRMQHEQTLEQALATLWREVAQAQGQMLRGPTTEAAKTLERRGELVERLLRLEETQPAETAGAALFIRDHFQTLLKAESAWLERVRAMARTNRQERC